MMRKGYVVRSTHLNACLDATNRGVALSVIAKYVDAPRDAVSHTGGTTQWPGVAQSVKRVALEVANSCYIDPTQQHSGPPMINQLKILVCSELISSEQSRPSELTKGDVCLMHDIQSLHESSLEVCQEVTKKGVLAYHVQSGELGDDQAEFHPAWNKPTYYEFEGVPKAPNHPEDQWLIEQFHVHESSRDLPGSLLQQATDEMTGKIFSKLSACRCEARVGYWATNAGEHEL